MPTSTGSISSEVITFYSDGTRIEGELYLPESGREQLRAVIVAHGFGGIKEFFVGDIAEVFCRAGFAALTFDYRGFGTSDGQRHRLLPMEQVDDVLAAATFLRDRPEIDPNNLSVYGTSFGGGVAIVAAALDGRMRSVVCAVGIADGMRWLRSLRRNWEWLEFQHALEKDRVERVLTGRSRVVEPEFIMVRDPESEKHEKYLRETWPNRAFQLTLASGDAITQFRPIDFVSKLAPCALLLVGVDEDGLTSFDQTEELYACASDPKELVTLSGLTHHQVYEPHHLGVVMKTVVGFVSKYSIT